MQKNKRLLIISCSTGSGHFRAAEALRLTCLEKYPDWQVEHIDMANYSSWIARATIIWPYNFFIYHAPKLYGFIYQITDYFFIQTFFSTFGLVFRLGTKKLFQKIKTFQPDVIISTHFLPQLILKNKCSVPIDVVITDYHAHKIWLSCNIRNYFAPTNKVCEEIRKKGRPCFVTGLPIHPKFFATKNIDDIKNSLGINNDLPTALIMPITGGSIDGFEIIKRLASNKDLNVIAITGRLATSLFEKAQSLNPLCKRFLLYKRSEKIDELMKVADVIISKAGGLTISEAIYLNKFLLVANPIPGQEEYNTEHLIKIGMGLELKHISDLSSSMDLALSKNKISPAYYGGNSNELILDRSLTN